MRKREKKGFPVSAVSTRGDGDSTVTTTANSEEATASGGFPSAFFLCGFEVTVHLTIETYHSIGFIMPHF